MRPQSPHLRLHAGLVAIFLSTNLEAQWGFKSFNSLNYMYILSSERQTAHSKMPHGGEIRLEAGPDRRHVLGVETVQGVARQVQHVRAALNAKDGRGLAP